jgi:hypothetical protein
LRLHKRLFVHYKILAIYVRIFTPKRLKKGAGFDTMVAGAQRSSLYRLHHDAIGKHFYLMG